MSIASQYAEYCADTSYDGLPPEVLAYAKRLVLDTIGIMIGSKSRVESSDSITAGVRAMNDGGRGATVLATGEQMSPANAALLNGALAHSLDYDDTHRGASLHPGAPVIAAALAAGEQTDATGEQFLAAVIAGYEITCRLGMAVTAESHYARGFHGTATCGVFGATAAAGMLHGLSVKQLEASFGINGSQASGSLQFLDNGAWNKRLHPGLSAHAAITAVLLAAEDFRGASRPITGDNGFFTGYTDNPQPELATNQLGTEFETVKTGIKPYPCCRYMHPPLDLLLEYTAETEISPAEITSIEIAVPTPGIRIIDSPTGAYPDSFVDAQFSMRFGSALALTVGDAGIESFINTVNTPYSEQFKSVYDNTSLVTDPAVDDKYPDQWSSKVTITTGATAEERYTEHARGEPEHRLSDEELFHKFDELVSHYDTQQTSELKEKILNLESYSITEVIESLTPTTKLPSDD